MTVERVRVGEVLRLARRLVSPEPSSVYTSIGIRSFGKGIFTYEPKPGSELGSLRYFQVEPGRLLLSNIKGWEGAIAVSLDEHSGCIASNRFLPYEPVDDRVDVNWAKWFFLSERGLELIGQASPGSADRNRTLAMERFEALVIPLPPIDQQRLAAQMMGRVQRTVDEVRERRTRSLRLQAALMSGLVASPSSEADDWREVALGDVLTESREHVIVEPDESYRNVGVYSFGKGFIDRGSLLGSETSYKRLTRLRTHDLVVTKLNGWEGGVAVVGPDVDGACVSGEYPAFRPDPDQVVPGFLAGVARAPWFWEQLASATRGSMVRRRRVNPTDVLKTRIALPTLELQAEIARRVRSLERIAQSHEELDRRLDALPASALNSLVGRDAETGRSDNHNVVEKA